MLIDASYYIIFCSIEMGEQALVKTVANVFREICYANRDQMTAGIICAGWDKRQGGQVIWFENLFNLFSIGFVIFLQLIETLDILPHSVV